MVKANATAVPQEDVWVPTACDMCYTACTIKVRRVNGVAVKIEGIPEAPPNYGKVCAKGHAALMNLYNPARVKTPLLRTNPQKGIGIDPQWQEITWDEAMALMVAKLRAVHEKDPRRLVGATFDTHARITFWAFLTGFGTPNYTTVSASYYCGNGVHPVAYTMTGANDVHADLPRCRYMIQFGTQYGFVTQYNAMGFAQELAEARRRGMKLVAIDPVLSVTAAQADEWVPIRPGTDAALALSMMQVLINELGLYDRDYLLRYTNAPYLIGANGRYVREEGSAKPLVWDRRAGAARAHDAADPLDCALEGSYRVAGVEVKPAFQLFQEHLRSYTPEAAAAITTVPAATIRRLAREFGENARIGAKIVIEGLALPLRPVAATWYRGVSAHKHGMLNGMAIALLNLVVGAFDVPGGLVNTAAAGPTWFPEAGQDGMIRSRNPYLRHHRNPLPPRPVRAPQTLELLELFPVSVYAHAMLALGILEPERFGVPYSPEVLLHCRANLMATTADPALLAEALRRIPYMISFADHHNETTEFADLLLPDAHALERLAPLTLNPYVHYRHVPNPGGDWTFNCQQPIVHPMGQARHWVEVLYEVAERLGIQGDVYAAFNVLAGLEGPYRLDPSQRYTWEELCDHWMRAWCGEEHGLAYFRQHGYCKVKPRSVLESYPRAFHTGRVPLYLEHFLQAGEEVRRYTEEHHIPWDTSDYVALVAWHPCPASQEASAPHDLYLVNAKLPFLAFTLSGENPWLMDVAERNAKVFNVGMHPQTARRKGIAEGDLMALETPEGRKALGHARLTEGIHPEVLVAPSILGRWVASSPKAHQGVHCNSLIRYALDRLDTVSAALDACVRVKVTKVGGPASVRRRRVAP